MLYLTGVASLFRSTWTMFLFTSIRALVLPCGPNWAMPASEEVEETVDDPFVEMDDPSESYRHY